MGSTDDGVVSGGLPPAGSIEEALARIETAVSDLAALTAPGVLDGWDAPSIGRLIDARSRVRSVTGRLDGVRYTLLPRIENEGSWRAGGMARTFTSWLRVREGVSAGTARKDVTIARRLATALPVTRERLVAGTLGVDHARVMTEVAPTSETRTDALGWLVDTRTGEMTTPERLVQTVAVDFPDPVEDPDGTVTRDLMTRVLEDAVADGTLVTGEGLVLREAGVLNADQFRTVVRRFATVTDPDTDDLEDDKAAGEFLDLSKTWGGYHVAGFLTDEHGLLLSTAVNAVLGAPAAEDTRIPGQRRAQGLADVARLVLDTNQASPGAAIPPHLNVTVSWSELVTQITRTKNGLCVTCGQATPARGTRTSTSTSTSTGTGTGTGATSTAVTGTGARGAGTAGTGMPGTGTGTAGAAGTGPARPGAAGVGAAGAGDANGPRGTGGNVAGGDMAGWGGGTGGTMPALSGPLTPGGPVFTETGDRAPRSLPRRLACDSTVTRIVFGPDGTVLDVGRAQRTVTGQMRRAVIARDQHCVYPGCDQPPSRCEVHHAITHWAHGGDTSVANSALLCWHHHALVDTRGITMHWTGKPTTTTTGALVETGWTFTNTHGHHIRLPDPVEAPPPPTEPPAEPPTAEAA